jgi:hypothetical protein
LQEHGEREARAVRLLREGSVQFLYLIAHERESAVAAWFSISRVLSDPESSRPVSTSQLKCAMELRSRAATNRISALTSEIRRATNTGEIRHFSTLLNSGDSCAVASWRSACFGEECGRSLKRSEQFTNVCLRRSPMKIIALEEHYGLPVIYGAAHKANDPVAHCCRVFHLLGV